jgi:hypothetical protein
VTEKNLINQIKQLKQIKPQKDWVFSLKTDLFKDELKESFVFFPLFKPALACLTMFALFFGLFGFAQTSVPGDLLYPVKKIAEKGQLAFVSQENRPQNSLVMADKRLEELIKIVESNQVKKLATAINEVESSVSEAARNISRIEATSSNPVIIKDIVDKTKKLEFRIEEIRALGVVIGGEELQEVSARLEVKVLLSDLENRTLTEQEQEVLAEMNRLAEEKEYEKVLEMFFSEFNKAEEIKQDIEQEIEQEEEETQEIEE